MPAKVKGAKLLAHEQALLSSGNLSDVTHANASALWLSAGSTESDLGADRTLVYRPMGDREYAHLLTHGELPDTQPYQTIVEGATGRAYAEKYLRGLKWVDSSPTTVVEFNAPRSLVETLFAKQQKVEDGAISHGLGDKGGKGLSLFNAAMRSGDITHRIVLVKRCPRLRSG